MLTSLSIRDIVLIEALDLEFTHGLGVLTGETGAGKSILLDSLGLALGMRADSGLVRAGCERAAVTAAFDAGVLSGAARALLAENEIELEPGEPLLIRRTLRADGGSRAFINDQPCSAALLRDLGAFLVEIHGQNDDRGLINPRGHRALLDTYAGVDGTALSALWRAWGAAKARLAEARAAVELAERDREFLEHAVEELTAFNPVAGEESELAGERSDMQKGERLTDDLSAVMAMFDGHKGPLTLVRAATRRLDRIAEEHPLLEQALESLDRALVEAEEAEATLRNAAEALAFSPAHLEAVETRLFDLRALARKHNVQPDELAALRDSMAAKLGALNDGGVSLAALESAEAAARVAFVAAAEAQSARRIAAAGRLDAAVMAELVPLKLDAARFRTEVTRLDEGAWGPHGMDHAEFLIATNAGAGFGQLGKVASGGELSRFILALKVALAEKGGAGTIIFDEIDRGVGGAVAQAIGDRLARLAAEKQLLAVTHSPQVAARGRHHFFIAKSSDGTVTRTDVALLDDAGRRQEIARMLSGAEITDEARAQADRLMEGV
jgi:DNA repair protein RecN (Recombination protein N)